MNNLINKIKRIINQIRGRYNSPLPTGMEEFETWVKAMINTYDLPTQDLTSIKFTLASIIMHLRPEDAEKPMLYFVKMIRAACAKQVAGQAFYDIKQEQQKKQAEATAALQVASDEQSK